VIATVGSNLARTCYAEPCLSAVAWRRLITFSALPTPQRQAPFVPSGSRRELATHLRWPTSFPLFTIIHKVHLALLRVTPQAPRNGGMYAALRAKEEIVHPASIGHPSASSGLLRITLSVPGLLNQRPSQILLCQARCGWRLLPPPMAAAPGGCCPLLYVRLHSYLIAPDVHSLPSSTSCCFRMTPKPPRRGMYAAL
jgi:hypothetical protein